jgi:hypothetical protein
MNATAVSTAARPAATKAAIRTPALPLTGNAAIDAKITAAQAALEAVHAIKPFGRGGEDRLSRALAKLQRALDGIVSPRLTATTRAEAETRVQAYLNGKALLTLDDDAWRLNSVDKCLRMLNAHGEPEAGVDAFRCFYSDLCALNAPPPARPTPSVRDAFEAYTQAHAAHGLALDAHRVVEAREIAGEISEDHPDLIAADAAVEIASDAEDDAWRAFMATPAANPDDVMFKQEAASACEDVRKDPDTARETYNAIQADMRRLFGGSAPTDPDAELLALGRDFMAAWDAERAYDIRQGDEGYEALLAATSEIGDRIQAIRPTTLEGYRLKARVAQHCQTDDLSLSFELTTQTDGDSGVAQTIVNDLLGLEVRPEEEREADEAHTRAAFLDARRPAARVFVSAYASYVAVKDDDRRALEAAKVATAAVEAEAPVPPELRKGDAGHYWRRTMIENSEELSFAEKVEKLAVFDAWKPLRDAAEARHRERELDAAWEAINPQDAFVALHETPAPTAEALTEKVRIYIAEVLCTEQGMKVDDPDTLSRLLSDPDIEGAWGMVRVYQDLLRLTHQSPELANAQAYDPAPFVAAFEALPGHYFSPMMGPTYTDEAWPDRPTDDAVTITDPARLAAYAAFRGRTANDYSRGIQLGDSADEAVRLVFADDPEERDRLLDALAGRRVPPVGLTMWRDLPEWKQDAVRAYLRHRPADAAPQVDEDVIAASKMAAE